MIYAQNVNGLKTKTTEFLKESASSDFDIFLLTETNLDESFYDNEVFCDEFVVFRNDRNVRNNHFHKKSGGGVMIAVKHRFSSQAIQIDGFEVLEQICVEISVPKKKIFLICVYFPPNSPSNLYKSHVSFVEEICKRSQPDDIILCYGDFNLPELSWATDRDENFMYATNASSDSEIFINDGFLSSGLRQVSNIKNERGKMLDLVFTNNWDDVAVNSTDPIVKSEAHHETFHIKVSNLVENRGTNSKEKFLNFKKTDFANVNLELSGVNWIEMFKFSPSAFKLNNERHFHKDLFLWFECLMEIPRPNCEVEGMLWIFLVIFGSSILRNTPVKSIKSRPAFPPWFDNDLIKLCRYKNNIHKKLSSKDVGLHQKYKEVRREFKALCDISFKKYNEEMSENLRENPKKFFDYVNQRKKTKRFPSMMKFGNKCASNDKEISDLFANFFSSVFDPPLSGCSSEPPLSTSLDLNQITFLPLDVVKGLNEMNGNKGPGPDGIPPKVLKETAESICFPLCAIFNKSLKSGVFPEAWKFSLLVPIFKKGDKSDVNNYRSVAIQNSMAKLFDMMTFKVVRYYLNKSLSFQQHGFVSNKSTATNLLLYSSDISSALESGAEVDSIYTDFSKAFDKVSHRLVIEKLAKIGFSGSLLDWFQSYLVNRKYFVKFGTERSFEFVSTSGVPPGTHGGPDLFLAMINDLPEVLMNSKISMYADDCKIYKTISSDVDSVQLQKDLNRFDEWCDNNQLFVNTGKCSHISFTRQRNRNQRSYFLNDKLLAVNENVRDLGVEFCLNLSFSDQVNSAVSKAMKVLGFIRRFSKDFDDPDVLKTLYFSLVRPHLEYCSIIWSPHTLSEIGRIESVQRKFTKLMCFLLIPQRKLCYEDRCSYLGLETLEKRRKVANQSFMAKVLVGQIDSSELMNRLRINVPRISSRGADFLNEPMHRTIFGSNNAFSKLIRDFNDVQNQFDFNVSIDDFKSRLRM